LGGFFLGGGATSWGGVFFPAKSRKTTWWLKTNQQPTKRGGKTTFLGFLGETKCETRGPPRKTPKETKPKKKMGEGGVTWPNPQKKSGKKGKGTPFCPTWRKGFSRRTPTNSQRTHEKPGQPRTPGRQERKKGGLPPHHQPHPTERWAREYRPTGQKKTDPPKPQVKKAEKHPPPFGEISGGPDPNPKTLRKTTPPPGEKPPTPKIIGGKRNRMFGRGGGGNHPHCKNGFWWLLVLGNKGPKGGGFGCPKGGKC